MYTSSDRMLGCTDVLIHDYDRKKYEVNDQPNLPLSYKAPHDWLVVCKDQGKDPGVRSYIREIVLQDWDGLYLVLYVCIERTEGGDEPLIVIKQWVASWFLILYLSFFWAHLD